nr:uncharacterized protein LOC114821395 [Malus domestica]
MASYATGHYLFSSRKLDESTTVRIEKYKSFLQRITNSVNIRHEGGKISNISLVRFYMFSNSTVWSSSKEKVQLIANVYRLHKDETFDIVRAFTAQFGNWKYDDWQNKVDNHVVFKAVKIINRTNADSAKVEVLRIPIPVYTTAESWLLYVHNCMKHYWEHAKRLQKKEHGTSRVLEKLTKLFPTLIEDMYAGLAQALYADKVRHPRFMSREIVKGGNRGMRSKDISRSSKKFNEWQLLFE